MKEKPIQFSSKMLDGQKGQLMLQITKSFKGDPRFKLNQRFEEDVEIEKLPEKFKKTLEKDLMQIVIEKTKPIRKQQPTLIQRRFEPGTAKAQQIVKKAEGRKKHVEGVMKSQKKKLQKKAKVSKGVNKLAKADLILNGSKASVKPPPKFKVLVKGDRKQAFKASQFKLFS